MSVFYDEVDVELNGIMTVKEFPVPLNGRTVKFYLPNGYIQKKAYIYMEGQYFGPFIKAEPIKTPVHGLGILKAGVHSANVIVIDTSQKALSPIELKINPIPVTLSSGEQAVIHLNGTLNVSIRVTDSDALIRDYDIKKILSAETRAESVLVECFQKEIRSYLSEHFGSGYNMNVFAALDHIADEIRCKACSDAENYLENSWFEVVACRLDLQSSNLEEIVEKENYLWKLEQERNAKRFQTDEELRKLQEETKIRLVEKTADALLTVYGSSVIPDKMVELMGLYVQNYPTMEPNELVEICREFKKLSERTSPKELLQQIQLLGYLPE